MVIIYSFADAQDFLVRRRTGWRSVAASAGINLLKNTDLAREVVNCNAVLGPPIEQRLYVSASASFWQIF